MAYFFKCQGSSTCYLAFSVALLLFLQCNDLFGGVATNFSFCNFFTLRQEAFEVL